MPLAYVEVSNEEMNILGVRGQVFTLRGLGALSMNLDTDQIWYTDPEGMVTYQVRDVTSVPGTDRVELTFEEDDGALTLGAFEDEDRLAAEFGDMLTREDITPVAYEKLAVAEFIDFSKGAESPESTVSEWEEEEAVVEEPDEGRFGRFEETYYASEMLDLPQPPTEVEYLVGDEGPRFIVEDTRTGMQPAPDPDSDL